MAKEEHSAIQAAKEKLDELRRRETSLDRQLRVIVREQNLLRLADAEAYRVQPNFKARTYHAQVRRKNLELSRRKIATELDRVRSSIPIQEALLQRLANKGRAFSGERGEEMQNQHVRRCQQAMERGR